MRVRFEDGVEVSRTSEGRHVLLEPQIRIVGYGTKVVIHTAATADTTIEYYRKIQVFATSYHPCGLGIVGNPNACSYTTRSGHAVEKGVIAMVASWYLLFQGDPVYVDGYGPATVEDSGVGPNAPYWIDLAYPSREEYVGWHRMTTLYFLTPVPANVPWILP
jgi:3D (Asp-Asp-Asp) domain-containing protein